jgi:hypothetical protein
MEKPEGFIKAMLMLRMSGESLTQFRNEFARLSEDDKTWFKDRFKIEYGWEY